MVATDDLRLFVEAAIEGEPPCVQMSPTALNFPPCLHFYISYSTYVEKFLRRSIWNKIRTRDQDMINPCGCSILGSGKVLLVGATLLLASPVAATPVPNADEWRAEESTSSWIPPRPSTEPVEVTRSDQKPRQLGRAPYLCTPSGFGRTATCYLRADYASSR
jgi:hypothetical protein